MKPASIYLDQNIYGNLYDYGQWQAHPIAKLLQVAASEKVGYVWISPTHVAEISQAPDPLRRRGIAKIMLELGGACRMLPSADFMLVEVLGEFINRFVPDAYNRQPFVANYIDIYKQIWQGNLAMMALDFDVPLGKGIAEIRRTKQLSRLIHARIFADPENSIDKIVSSAENWTTTTDLDPLGIANLTEQEISDEINQLQNATVPVKQFTIKKIQKHKKEIAQRYGAIDIGGALQAVFFQYPLDLELTFNAGMILQNWDKFQQGAHASSLPPAIKNIPAEELCLERATVVMILNLIIEVAANVGLSIATMGFYCLIRELEICLNQGKLPTAGATLDIDHATAVYYQDIFVVRDAKLADSVRAYVGGIEKDTVVVSDERQLAKALAKWKSKN